MILYVRTLKGETIYIEVECSDTVEKVKELIHIKLNIPIENQKICFAGKILSDHRVLAGYGIQKESSLVVIAMAKKQGDQKQSQ